MTIHDNRLFMAVSQDSFLQSFEEDLRRLARPDVSQETRGGNGGVWHPRGRGNKLVNSWLTMAIVSWLLMARNGSWMLYEG